jgi:hypothetical protein
MTDSDVLRRELIRLLDGVDAHMPFDEAVADFPDDAINRRPPNVDYTPWHLVAHLRLTQADILDYIENRAYIEADWPEAYWRPAKRLRRPPSSRARSTSSRPIARPPRHRQRSGDRPPGHRPRPRPHDPAQRL